MAGAAIVHLSGSGPTLFAPFRRLAEAAEVARRAATEDISVWLTRTVRRGEVAQAQWGSD
jgi:4-diphosphocytidyl-2C-methyl-D-erythritol kinase